MGLVVAALESCRWRHVRTLLRQTCSALLFDHAASPSSMQSSDEFTDTAPGRDEHDVLGALVGYQSGVSLTS